MKAELLQPYPAMAPALTDPRAGKYLTFKLGIEEFGIQVLRVKEVRSVHDITVVPGTPRHVKGVIKVRGKLIPVLDLRLNFGFPKAPFEQSTCIVVAEVIEAGEPAIIGLLVDGMPKVLNLSASDIEDPPDFGEAFETPFVLGIAKMKGSVRTLLNIDDVLTLQKRRARLAA